MGQKKNGIICAILGHERLHQYKTANGCSDVRESVDWRRGCFCRECGESCRAGDGLRATCYSVADIVREAFDLVREDRSRQDVSDVCYYFRGERKEHSPIASAKLTSGIYRNSEQAKHESDIFNEALRAFPEEFAKDRTTFEMLTRMQHYGYPTRLADVTPKLMTAIGMVRSEGATPKSEDRDRDGYIHVYRVRADRIKYGTSDTVTALSNLARLKNERVTLDDLRYLEAECKNERAGFFWDAGSETSERLVRDIQKVWCVRPMVNNIRVNFQAGEFFLFGCGENKAELDASFEEYDYDNEDAATFGIARIGVLTVTPSAKAELNEFKEALDIGDERLYPDFAYHSTMLRNKYKKGNL